MDLKTIFFVFLTFSLLISCEQDTSSLELSGESENSHPLQGGWLGADGTVFHFREDNTFHGYDFRHREIWGNWVVLSEERIGFQSLMHDSFYNPQYAIIDTENLGEMDYIVTGGQHFISAKRIPEDEATAAIEIVIEKNLHTSED